MIQNRPVLAAVDIDANATLIIQRAFQFAVAQSSPLIVAHMVNYRSGFEIDHIPLHTPAQIAMAMQQTAQYWLLDLLQRMGARATIVVEHGQIYDHIIALIEDLDVGCIFIGTPSPFLSAIGNLSNDADLKNSHCDVQIVAHRSISFWRGQLSKMVSLFKKGDFQKCRIY